MLKPEQSRDLRKTHKRLVVFLFLIFVLDVFIAFLLFRYTKIHSVLCGFIIIVITAFLYLLFLGICARIDKKKQQRLEESGRKDPFSRK